MSYEYWSNRLEESRITSLEPKEKDHQLIFEPRSTHGPERRVFYIDVGHMTPNLAEAVLEMLKDQFNNKKQIEDIDKLTKQDGLEIMKFLKENLPKDEYDKVAEKVFTPVKIPPIYNIPDAAKEKYEEMGINLIKAL